MRKTSWLMISGLLTLLLVLAAACGGGDDKGGDASSNQDGSNSSGALTQLLVSNPSEALGKSADTFADEVESVQGKFSLSFTGGAFAGAMGGDFAFRAPDQVHMTMNLAMDGEDALVSLGDMNFEILMLGDQMYINTPLFGGWVVMSMDDLGVDGEQYQKLVEAKSPFDYSALVGGLDAVENLGTEQIDGTTYTHLRVESDIAELIGAFGDSLSSGGLDPATLSLDKVSGPFAFDLWVDPDSGLPFRVLAAGDLAVPGVTGTDGESAVGFELQFDFTDYNGNVDMPAAPQDAKSFVEIFGALGGEDTWE